MKVKVHVTDEQVSKGKGSSCWSCPVALALNDVLAPDYVACVLGSTLEVFPKTKLVKKKYSPIEHVSKFPKKVAEAIKVFDLRCAKRRRRRGIPKEFDCREFSLNIPAKFLRKPVPQTST